MVSVEVHVNSPLVNGGLFRHKSKRYQGESDADYKARLKREEQLVEDRYRDPSNGPDGRKMPVRYD